MSHVSKTDTKTQNLVYLNKASEAMVTQYTDSKENFLFTVKGYGKNENIED